MNLGKEKNCKVVIYYAAEIYNNYAQNENKSRKNEDKLTIIPMGKTNGKYSGINFEIPKDSTEKRKCQLRKVVNLIKKIFHSDVNINPKSDEFVILLDEIFERFENNNFEQNPNQNRQSSQTNYQGGFNYSGSTNYSNFSDIFDSFFENYEVRRNPNNPFMSQSEINGMELRKLISNVPILEREVRDFCMRGSFNREKVEYYKQINQLLQLALSDKYNLQTKQNYYNQALQEFEKMKRQI